MTELGSGSPLVLIPGLPGPWQYVAPAVNALSTHFRVLTSSLGPECTIESDAVRILDALNARQIERAVICGISLGGLVALRFAAAHPERTAALVLASTPGPGATLRPHHRFYVRWPWLCGPLFVLETPLRLRHEAQWTVTRTMTLVKALVSAPVSFAKIARRAKLIESTDIDSDCGRIVSPTLVITGEQELDLVVPVESTVRYCAAISGAAHVVIKGTGHLGPITHAIEFAALVREFVRRAAPRADVA
jgi:pimeloyl-ACP methyl ester carboxylesterase